MVDGGDDTHILLRPVWIHVKGQGLLVSLELMNRYLRQKRSLFVELRESAGSWAISRGTEYIRESIMTRQLKCEALLLSPAGKNGIQPSAEPWATKL